MGSEDRHQNKFRRRHLFHLFIFSRSIYLPLFPISVEMGLNLNQKKNYYSRTALLNRSWLSNNITSFGRTQISYCCGQGDVKIISLNDGTLLPWGRDRACKKGPGAGRSEIVANTVEWVAGFRCPRFAFKATQGRQQGRRAK
jgi:hypothetical protein